MEKVGQDGLLPWIKKRPTQIQNDRTRRYLLWVVWCLPLLFVASDPDWTLFGYLFLGGMTFLGMWVQMAHEKQQKYCPWCQSVNDRHAVVCRRCGRQPAPMGPKEMR